MKTLSAPIHKIFKFQIVVLKVLPEFHFILRKEHLLKKDIICSSESVASLKQQAKEKSERDEGIAAEVAQ